MKRLKKILALVTCGIIAFACTACSPSGGGGGGNSGGEDWSWVVGDGKTRLHITIPPDGFMDVPLYFKQSVANSVTFDWGDGTPAETTDSVGSATPRHTYAKGGNYVITIDATDNSGFVLGLLDLGYSVIGRADSPTPEPYYRALLKKAEIGKTPSNSKILGDYAFYKCMELESVAISDGVTSVGRNTFGYCYALRNIRIPDSVTSFAYGSFYSCQSLESVVLPNKITSAATYLFYQCNGLKSVTIPDGVTEIGKFAFAGCTSLTSIVMPPSVNSLGEGAFRTCYRLRNAKIPEGVTSLGDSAFYQCYSLESVEVPGGVTSIGGNMFNGCSSVAYFDFTKHTEVPTLATSAAFTYIHPDCEIRVPAALADEWKAATNWSTYADYIVGV